MNDFLKYLKDLEQGKTDVTPDELAPEPDPVSIVGTEYDETKDPEIKREASLNKEIRLQEAVRLYEEKRGERISRYLATTDNPSYDGYMNSEFSKPEDTEKGYNSDVRYFQKQGMNFRKGDKFGASGGKGYQDEAGTHKTAAQKKQAKSGPYEADRPENYELSGEYAKHVSALSQQYGTVNIRGSADEMFQDVFNIVKNIITRKTDKKHGLIYGDPGVGKTFEVTETCNRYMSQSPTKAQYVYEAGDIGTSMSTLVPFFYKHSQNKLIVLDDNDKMIMKGLSQDIMNIMKGLLDPMAATKKPVSVRANMLDVFAKRLADLEEGDDDDIPGLVREGVMFEIDAEALKENYFRLKINDELVVDKLIPLQEAQELQNQLIPLREEKKYVNPYAKDIRHIREATNKERLEDIFNQDNLIGSDEDEDEFTGMSKQDRAEIEQMRAVKATEQGQDGKSFPRRFMFNSSVIFVSNLELDDINTAVLDRVEAVEVKLSLDQFLERLGKIYGNLAKIGLGSQVDPKIRKWSRECVFTVIGIVIEAWKANVPVFGSPIEINRKLTFRMFDEFVSAWERYAMDRCERVYGKELDVNDKALTDKLSKDLIPEIIRRKVIPFMRTIVKAN